MHAAVDTDCLSQDSESAYWAAVDEIHSNYSRYGNPDVSNVKAQTEIDDLVTGYGKMFHLNIMKLEACMSKQDTQPELDSLVLGKKLSVEATPTLFINGLKINGALPLGYIFSIVDDALRSEGKIPPPDYVQLGDPSNFHHSPLSHP